MMKIVVADDDPVSLELMVRMLRRRTRHSIVAVSSGQVALELMSKGEVPDVLILDWEMPELSGPEVCARTRALALPVQPYLLLVTVRSRCEDYVEGLAAGADDMLSKPVPPELLIARLGVARRRPRPGAAKNAVSAAFQEASATGDGELIVRDADVSARIYFRQGKVGWVHMSDESSTLVDILAPAAKIDLETASAIVEECRVTDRTFGIVLEEWGLVERARLRECLKIWFTRRLAIIQQFTQPETLFLGHPVEYSGDMLFTLAELEQPAPASKLPDAPQNFPTDWPAPQSEWHRAFVQPSTVSDRWAKVLDSCMSGDGVLSVALVQQTTGCCLGSSGNTPNPDIVWANIQNMTQVAQHESVESCLLTTSEHYHLVCSLSGTPGVLAYAVFRRQATSLAAALLALKAGLSTAESVRG